MAMMTVAAMAEVIEEVEDEDDRLDECSGD